MASVAGDIGDDEGRQHTEYCCAQTVEELDQNDEIWISDAGQQQAADRQGTVAEKQDRPAAPSFSGASGPWRDQRLIICGPTIAAAISAEASPPARFVTMPAAIGSIAALAR